MQAAPAPCTQGPALAPAQDDRLLALQFALQSLRAAQERCRALTRQRPDCGDAEALEALLSLVATAVQQLSPAAALSAPPCSARFSLEAVDVAELLTSSLAVVQARLPPDTVVSGDLAKGAVAFGHASALHDVFVSLLCNAAEALQGAESPQLHLDVWCPDDTSLWVLIGDNGCGMDEDVRARCFEPFYTHGRARPAQGLGLTVARGTMEQLGGFLELSSAAGLGSTLLVGLRRPVSEWPAREASVLEESMPHLLLVDDDQLPLPPHSRDALSERFHVTTMLPGHALAHLLVPTYYDLVLFNCKAGESRAVSIVAALSVSRPDQAARAVLLQAASLERRRWRSLSDAGVWQVEDTLCASELLSSVEQLLALWTSLRLRNPRAVAR